MLAKTKQNGSKTDPRAAPRPKLAAKNGTKPNGAPDRRKKLPVPVLGSVSRREGDNWQRCFWNVQGIKEHRFPLEYLTREQIAERWGSGTYRVARLQESGAVAGAGGQFTIDDPKYPPKSLYPNPPMQAPAMPVASAPAEDPLLLLAAADKFSPMMALQFVMAAQREAKAEARRDAELQIQRERLAMQQTLEGQKLIFESLLKANAPVAAAPATDPRLLKQLADLSERIEDLQEDREEASEPTQETPATYLMKQAAVIVQKITETPALQEALIKRLMPPASST